MNTNGKLHLLFRAWTIALALAVPQLGVIGCTRDSAVTPSASPGVSSPASTQHQHASPEEDDKILYWTCSMHPEVRSDKPGKCPICHMDLIPVKKTRPAPDSKSAASQPKGRTSFHLSPEQEALTGSQPITVESRVLKREIEAPGRVTGSGRVSFQIFEQDIGLIKVGQSFTAQTPSLPEETLRGKIAALAPILDPMTRTARVEGAITGAAASKLRAESTVTGMIEVETARVVAIPESAVMHTGSSDLVFTTDGKGAYEPRAVKLGIKAQGYYEVISGLSSGALISSGPNFLLDSEARIRASRPSDAAEATSHDHSNH